MKEAALYEVGEIVKLKSGGPDMTIKEVRTNINEEFIGSYYCQWFAGKKLDVGSFPQESLIKVESE